MTKSIRQSVLTFGDKCPKIWGLVEREVLDMDVVIAYHASQGAGCNDPKGRIAYAAPDRPPLHAIDGRPC